MSRYRPPAAPKSNYLTAEGANLLRRELQQLWKVERPEVTAAVSAAAKNGDRSENGDYIYGKRRLREIDSRVRYLSKRLESAKVITDQPDNTQRIYFAAWVTLEDDLGHQQQFRIVGPDELNHHDAYISLDSPTARALIGKQLDDDITVITPTGEKQYCIIAINY